MTTTYPSPPPAPDAVDELFDLSDVVEELASGHYLVTRAGASTNSHGVATPGAPVYFYALGSMQPTSGRDIDRLPEGLRTRDTKTFFTLEVLIGPTPGTNDGADQITIDGELFEVQMIQDWQQLGNYHKVIATKVQT